MAISDRPTRYPLSAGQRLLRWTEVFTLDRNEMRAFNVLNFYVRVRENGQPKLLERTLNHVIDCNDSLRIHIFREALRTWQCVQIHHTFSCEYAKVSGEAALQRYIRKRQQEVIAWTDKYLIHGTLIRVGEADDWVLLVRVHHAACDGYSIHLICKQISEAYALYVRNEMPKPEEYPSFLDTLERGRQYLASNAHKEDRAFWKNLFNHQPRYSMPIGKRAVHTQCGYLIHELNANEYLQLKKLAKRMECSHMSLLLAMIALTVYALTGKNNFCLFTMTHGRLKYPDRRATGCLMNTVPVMYLIKKKRSVGEQIPIWHAGYLECLLHGRLPLSEQTPLTYWQSIRQGGNFNHGWFIFSPMESLQCAPDSGMEAHMVPFTHIGQQLYLSVHEAEGERLEMELFYQSLRFSRDTMERAFDALLSILRMVEENTDLTPRAIRKALPKYID